MKSSFAIGLTVATTSRHGFIPVSLTVFYAWLYRRFQKVALTLS